MLAEGKVFGTLTASTLCLTIGRLFVPQCMLPRKPGAPADNRGRGQRVDDEGLDMPA